ncbi:unnamed protein product [Spodoptera littoralis]|uniref:Uncharacterized protein n=1 Tax=Spodoptera littoralis TaxID=7109 RepID=A0A9P0I268_SPOLI|nr:unnamed protein product [Spodoptera littoralis]CAH1638353.1 unnamed protein product [Spodoptera littoralis]
MRLLVFLTTITIILICDVESFDYRHHVYQIMLENNITLPKKTYIRRDYGNITRYCTNTTKKCIWKCCNFGESVEDKRCIPAKHNFNNNTKDNLSILNDVLIYDSKGLRTAKTLQDKFHLVPNHFSNEEFRMNSLALNIYFEIYLSEDGVLFYDIDNNGYSNVNVFDKISVNNFCIDEENYVINFFVDFGNEHVTPKPDSLYYRTVAHILCVILVTSVLVMYCVRPHLRDLHGMLVMTLLCCYLGKSIIEIHHIVFIHVISRKIVLLMETLHIFCNLATYSLTNVMFHIVWKSIKLGGNTMNTRRNKIKQYIKYIAYAFGLPLILTLAILYINSVDMRSISWFITPKMDSILTCTGKEMIVYIYIPGMILFLYNIFLCCLIIPKVYEGFFGSLIMTYTYNDAIKYDVISFSQNMKLMTFMTISETANAYSTWNMTLYGIVSTNKWLLGVVIVLIFLHDSNAKRKCPTTPVRQNMLSMTEMQ